ncbi:hypothetical protein BDR06DRAFT_971417 [Suillus hirtellus]|nr:hypothetical protein BDR06DRAFT_971417 [Suillus hirtellus]
MIVGPPHVEFAHNILPQRLPLPASVTRRQSAQRRSRAINKDREVEREQDAEGEGFDDLIHWQDGDAIIRFKKVLDHAEPTATDINKSTKSSRTLTREERTTHDIVTPRGTYGNTNPDDYVRHFLSSLRPNLEPKIQEFKRIGLDSKTTLDAFVRWQGSEREGWIFSQNLYLQLTPLELSGLMLGIERLSDEGNGA